MKAEEIYKGEQLIIRDWEDMEEEYGIIDATGAIKIPGGFPKTMKYLCGTVFQVAMVSGGRVYPITEDRDKFRSYLAGSGEWVVTADMCKPHCNLSPFSDDDLDLLFGGD